MARKLLLAGAEVPMAQHTLTVRPVSTWSHLWGVSWFGAWLITTALVVAG